MAIVLQYRQSLCSYTGLLVTVVSLPTVTLGEVQYARNGHHVTTLMHVDTSLPLWAFLDIYGTMKEIKSIGKLYAVWFSVCLNSVWFVEMGNVVVNYPPMACMLT